MTCLTWEHSLSYIQETHKRTIPDHVWDQLKFHVRPHTAFPYGEMAGQKPAQVVKMRSADGSQYPSSPQICLFGIWIILRTTRHRKHFKNRAHVFPSQRKFPFVYLSPSPVPVEKAPSEVSLNNPCLPYFSLLPSHSLFSYSEAQDLFPFWFSPQW